MSRRKGSDDMKTVSRVCLSISIYLSIAHDIDINLYRYKGKRVRANGTRGGFSLVSLLLGWKAPAHFTCQGPQYT
jgi:hypothetical protein